MSNPSSTSGSGIWWPSGNTIPTTITYPYPYATTTVSWPTPHPPYVLFKLPSNKIPDMVFLNGKALTLGILGSKSQCAFGVGNLIFDGKVLAKLPESLGWKDSATYTFILQYKTKTYHYYADIDYINNYILLKDGTNVIDAHLLSEIKRL